MKSVWYQLVGTVGVMLCVVGFVVQTADAGAIVVPPVVTNNCTAGGTGANPTCTGNCLLQQNGSNTVYPCTAGTVTVPLPDGSTKDQPACSC